MDGKKHESGQRVKPERAALPNVWFDTAASPLLYGTEVWAKAKSERVLFGSDYPLILYPRTDTAPGFGGLITEAKGAGAADSVFGGNATNCSTCSGAL